MPPKTPIGIAVKIGMSARGCRVLPEFDNEACHHEPPYGGHDDRGVAHLPNKRQDRHGQEASTETETSLHERRECSNNDRKEVSHVNSSLGDRRYPGTVAKFDEES